MTDLGLPKEWEQLLDAADVCVRGGYIEETGAIFWARHEIERLRARVAVLESVLLVCRNQADVAPQGERNA